MLPNLTKHRTTTLLRRAIAKVQCSEHGTGQYAAKLLDMAYDDIAAAIINLADLRSAAIRAQNWRPTCQPPKPKPHATSPQKNSQPPSKQAPDGP